MGTLFVNMSLTQFTLSRQHLGIFFDCLYLDKLENNVNVKRQKCTTHGFSTDYSNKRLQNLIPIIRLPFSEDTESNQIHSNKQTILPDQGVQLKI